MGQKDYTRAAWHLPWGSNATRKSQSGHVQPYPGYVDDVDAFRAEAPGLPVLGPQSLGRNVEGQKLGAVFSRPQDKREPWTKVSFFFACSSQLVHRA